MFPNDIDSLRVEISIIFELKPCEAVVKVATLLKEGIPLSTNINKHNFSYEIKMNIINSKIKFLLRNIIIEK